MSFYTQTKGENSRLVTQRCFLYYFTNYVKYSLFSKMIASREKFGFVFIERWLSNLNNIAFFKIG
ncbi:hypothetical protein DUHN53_09740 [Helicobacter pylori]